VGVEHATGVQQIIDMMENEDQDPFKYIEGDSEFDDSDELLATSSEDDDSLRDVLIESSDNEKKVCFDGRFKWDEDEEANDELSREDAIIKGEFERLPQYAGKKSTYCY
jgi:hypothetical protein